MTNDKLVNYILKYIDIFLDPSINKAAFFKEYHNKKPVLSKVNDYVEIIYVTALQEVFIVLIEKKFMYDVRLKIAALAYSNPDRKNFLLKIIQEIQRELHTRIIEEELGVLIQK